MATLYELSEVFQNIFDELAAIEYMEFDTDADGNYIDSYGNIVDDPEAYKASLLEAWCNTLDDLKIPFENKVEEIAICIKNLKADAEKIEAEEKALKARKDAKKREIDNLKNYLKTAMDQIGVSKIDMPKAKVSIRNNAESLVVDDEISFVNWAQENNDNLLKYSMPEIRKTDVKKILQSGAVIPHVHLTRTQSLVIK